MLRFIRGSFAVTVKCDCGFRRTANTDCQASVIAEQHTCRTAPPRSKRNANRNSR